MTYVIASATRNKIVLSLKKEQFIFVKFDQIYSKVNALNLALLASASYLDDGDVRGFLFQKITNENREISFTGSGNVHSAFLNDSEDPVSTIEQSFQFQPVPETDTQFFFFKTKDYVLFSFRGTLEGQDILTDLNAERVAFSEGVGNVHAGFYTAFKSIKKIIDDATKDAGERPIILCGHSLGGAIANLVGAYLRKKGHAKVMLYTFGCPLVGDSVFSNHFTKIAPIVSYRFIHNQDMITMIPPPYSHLRINILILGLVSPLMLIPATIDPFGKPFNHFGKIVFLRRIDREAFSVDVDRKTPVYIRAPSTFSVSEERPWWDKVLNWASVSGGDHFMKNYVSILGSDLKFFIRFYLGAKTYTIENTQKVMDYLESEIKLIQASHDELEKKLLLSGGGNGVYADATSTGSTPANKQSPSQKMALLEDALQSKRMELGIQKSTLEMLRTPGYSSSTLRNIVDLKISPVLKQELDYHATNILY